MLPAQQGAGHVVRWGLVAATALFAFLASLTLLVRESGPEVARQTLRLLQDIRSNAEAMYRVGDGRQTDVLRAQVEIARMVEDTVRMTTMRTGMAARLNALLDRPADAPVGSLGPTPAPRVFLLISSAGRPCARRTRGRGGAPRRRRAS